MCSERDAEGCEGEGGLTPPHHPALSEFKDTLFNLVHLCRTGSLASSSTPSPRPGPSLSRSQSIVSEDFSSVPPEEPEWLSKMAAARTLTRGLSGRSRPASRRGSGLTGGAGRPLGGGGGTAAPSPLRGSLNLVTSVQLEEAVTVGGSTPSPRTVDTDRQALFDRFGSFEGLSAALEDFYHRLCCDERVGRTIKQVPEQDVWLILTQLMALSLQQWQHQHGELLQASVLEDRQLWVRRCQALLRPAGTAASGEDQLSDQETAAVYDAVMTALIATLERLGALGCRAEGYGDCAIATIDPTDDADGSLPFFDDLPQLKPVTVVVSEAPQVW
ncbi:hypothetical protein Vretifemale_5279 [Volvox reticuliferus]|uniref:Uncharacterized protein n=2 Tax=Volvox reticuliferus TaxID=1737510 RepID=A0A8J4C8W8_9CHLO|nr:hypothetical protein Vretifemale_5279 [Volvox reticuliferus]